jgi:hypothetical protein
VQYGEVERLEPPLVQQLAKRFTAAVRAALEPAEAAFLDDTGPPMITSVILNGTLHLAIALYGERTLIEWDGTEDDALQIVDDCVESAAANISDGYWMTGGWNDRTTFPAT